MEAPALRMNAIRGFRALNVRDTRGACLGHRHPIPKD
jgi:hypothetical protein